MYRRVRIALILGGMGFLGGEGVAEAGLFFHHDQGPPPPGHPRVIEYTHARAGNPLCISRHAVPTDLPDYIGYYVGGGGGGGCLGSGGWPRRIEDGTWGRDYEGLWLPRHVRLGWNQGTRYQGGTGSYEPDGPVVPDVIGLTFSRLRNH
jgi:hypothetical protein